MGSQSKALWRSWLARRPVTAEVAGSSPVRVAIAARHVRAFRPGSSVGMSVRLKSGRSPVRSRPWPPSLAHFSAYSALSSAPDLRIGLGDGANMGPTLRAALLCHRTPGRPATSHLAAAQGATAAYIDGSGPRLPVGARATRRYYCLEGPRGSRVPRPALIPSRCRSAGPRLRR
jgi:hypothetical protein